MNHSMTYESYLQLDKLLSTQVQQSKEAHDEMLFIIIHQTYELWFKQIIHDGKNIVFDIKNNKLFNVLHNLKRIRSILKLIVSQVDILETMHPDSFASFRKYLGTASGFQSKQFRDIELLLGISKDNGIKNFYELSVKSDLWSSFLKNCINNIDIEKKFYDKFDDIDALLLTIYCKKSLYTEIVEVFLDIDQGFQEWRYRHIKLVERIIGFATMGTGGSDGSNYLMSTLSKSFCKELWKVRNIINDPKFIEEFIESHEEMIC
jgi:tryptophan 2,3-dioxygenase